MDAKLDGRVAEAIRRIKRTKFYDWQKRAFGVCRAFMFRKIPAWARMAHHRLLRSSRTFRFDGRTYRYFYHEYNDAWRTERTVEVPIVWDIVRQAEGKRILEVGNVLSHYYSVAHEIVDKYEMGEGVINEDVVDIRPDPPYDLIVSISTLEHVGMDEDQKDPSKPLQAVERLRSCLAPGGRLVVTIPLGQNPDLDRMLDEGLISLTRLFCLKRVSGENDWVETEWAEIRGSRSNDPYPCANALVVGVIDGAAGPGPRNTRGFGSRRSDISG